MDLAPLRPLLIAAAVMASTVAFAGNDPQPDPVTDTIPTANPAAQHDTLLPRKVDSSAVPMLLPDSGTPSLEEQSRQLKEWEYELLLFELKSGGVPLGSGKAPIR